jgi:aspartate-semialdehyde dehydrogenase
MRPAIFSFGRRAAADYIEPSRCRRCLGLGIASARWAAFLVLLVDFGELSVFETIAVVGATGNVGRIILELLEQRKFPARRVKLLASKRSAGKVVRFAGEDVAVEELTPESFAGVDLAIGSTPDETARDFVPWAVERGCTVVDESGYWRMDPKVPLVIPEVNPDALDTHQGLIASPNCSTTQMVVALKPLHDAARVRRVVVSTYQATSGAGLAASQELEMASHARLHGQAHKPEQFAHPIAFNLIPQIGSPKRDGYTSEEIKMVLETHKILGDDTIQICPTCVRVPVTNCHSESILVETERKITVGEARELFARMSGVVVVDDLATKSYPMPLDCTGRDEVFIGRIREGLSSPNGLAFWCVSDNLRKGAATNAVQIAELLATRTAAAK